MVSSLLKTPLFLLAGAGFCLTGCPDPQGRNDDFVERTAYSEAAGQCQHRPPPPPPPQISADDASGRWLLALASTIDATKPLIFEADVTVDTSAEPWTMDIEMYPLNVETYARTPLSASAEGVEIDALGNFEIDFGEIEIEGVANPITGGQIVTTLTMAGVVGTLTVDGVTGPTGPEQMARSLAAGSGMFCGAFGGDISVPAAIPLEGSVFGGIKLEADQAIDNTFDWLGSCPLPPVEEDAFVCEL